MSFVGKISNMFMPKKNTDVDEPAPRRKETKKFDWITPFDPTTTGQVTYAFEIGQKIGFPTIWMFSMRPVKYKMRSYIGLSVSLLQHPNKTQDHPIEIRASFRTELQRRDLSEKGFVTSTEEEDFGTRPTKGMLNFFEMANLHLCEFPDKKLKIKISFTLFAPFPITKYEVRYKASTRCDSDILKQLCKREFFDVLVKLDDGSEFHAYRIALARSAYFRELLLEQANSLNGQKQTLPIELHVNKPFDIMKIIICFVHFGHLLEELVDPKKTTMDFAKSLVQAADEFGLPDLSEFLLEFYPGLKHTNWKLPEPENMEVHEGKIFGKEELEKLSAEEEKFVPALEEID